VRHLAPAFNALEVKHNVSFRQRLDVVQRKPERVAIAAHHLQAPAVRFKLSFKPRFPFTRTAFAAALTGYSFTNRLLSNTLEKTFSFVFSTARKGPGVPASLGDVFTQSKIFQPANASRAKRKTQEWFCGKSFFPGLFPAAAGSPFVS
jgi:hypothetical protein